MPGSPNDPLQAKRRKANANAAANGSASPGRKDVSVEKQTNAPEKPTAEEKKKSGKDWDVAAAVAQTTVPAWLNIGIMMSLIFGGCCANVFALEAIIIDEPAAGALITFTQFVVTALLTLPNILSLSAGPRSLFIARRAIPLRSWMIYTAFFLTVNLLNNSAFAFEISVPLHIIIRSGGPVASMVIGHLYNSKRYTRTQVLAVLLLTIGVVGAALADANAKGKSLDIGLHTSGSEGPSLLTSLTGFTILGLAMILSAFQGVYADRLYETHGRNHWREALFYSHALSLPFFIPSYPKLLPQLKALFSSSPLLESISTPLLFSNASASAAAAASTAHITSARTLLNSATALLHSLPTHPLLKPILAQTPIKIVYLVLNALTQYVCIRGVHLLSAKSSSLTVTIVLNIRKLVSLILSVYVFGNVLARGVLVGAAVVFLGGGIYGYEGARLRRKAVKGKGE
ncbi:golgi uridine diphosphate-N- acetylglucosamine transporter [Onygenales sp. PD_10]|nr:golgi uridine diphosphate-N- acetylglucosamine transporter [Onygenales sp. PD_10]